MMTSNNVWPGSGNSNNNNNSSRRLTRSSNSAWQRSGRCNSSSSIRSSHAVSRRRRVGNCRCSRSSCDSKGSKRRGFASNLSSKNSWCSKLLNLRWSRQWNRQQMLQLHTQCDWRQLSASWTSLFAQTGHRWAPSASWSWWQPAISTTCPSTARLKAASHSSGFPPSESGSQFLMTRPLVYLSCLARSALQLWVRTLGSPHFSSARATCRIASGTTPGRHPSVLSQSLRLTSWTRSTQPTVILLSSMAMDRTQAASTPRERRTCEHSSPA
mmetsp:Transcript_106321/g.195185  ORF Transcript_106321/g.195185 Transcript_106321/m.195185 type:complete len:270 (+) Transcript_106321:285-1094(+)